jgi:Zn-dependent protease with chaperone function
MVAVLGLLVAINALFVMAVLWGFTILLPTVVTALFAGDVSVLSDVARVPVSLPTYGAIVALFLAGQLYYGYKRVLSSGTTGIESDHDIDEIVRRLSMAVEVPKPTTRVIDDEKPSCYTLGRFTDATIVVTTGLLSELDSKEIEAVLAHEIAHIANRDVTLMTVTTLMLETARRAHQTVRLVPRAFGGLDNLSGAERIVLVWALPLSVFVYIFVSPLLLVFPKLAGWATQILSHTREFAADEAGVQMTGEPLALATALVTLDETTTKPRKDLRTERTQALCIVPTTLVTGRQATSLPETRTPESDREEVVSDWLSGRTTGSPVSGTHPPVEERIERLRELAGEMEDQR